MISLLGLFADNLLPLLLAVLIGVLLQWRLDLNPRPLSQTVFHVFMPALVFELLVTTNIALPTLLRMALFTTIAMLSIGLVAWLLGRLLRLSQTAMAAFLLTSIFSNNGNFGLSLNQIAFGDEALAYASIFFVTSIMLINTLGVYIASVGQTDPKGALRGLLGVPAIYVIPVALLIRTTGWETPLALWRPIELLAAAAIPCMLIILGMQIARTGIPKRTPLLLAAMSMRLFIAPLLAYFAAILLQLEGAAFQSGVLEAAMPTAVLTSILALEYDAHPDFVSGVILISTFASPLTLTPLLAVLGA